VTLRSKAETATMNPRYDLRGSMREHPLFAELDDDTFEHVLRSSRVQPVSAGEFVFQRGDAATRFFVVLTGTLTLVLQSRAGDEKVVETLTAGATFAETLMFDSGAVYPMAAVATTSATVLAVPNDCFRAVLATSASTCLGLLAHTSRRLHALVREVESHSMTDARTRIVRHVLELAGPAATPARAPVEVTLAEPKQRIAARLGIAPETLSRTFRSLNDAGLMAVSGRRIRIECLDRLRAVA
jgi:CRP-like cAMP-binding protein